MCHETTRKRSDTDTVYHIQDSSALWNQLDPLQTLKVLYSGICCIHMVYTAAICQHAVVLCLVTFGRAESNRNLITKCE